MGAASCARTVTATGHRHSDRDRHATANSTHTKGGHRMTALTGPGALGTLALGLRRTPVPRYVLG